MLTRRAGTRGGARADRRRRWSGVLVCAVAAFTLQCGDRTPSTAPSPIGDLPVPTGSHSGSLGVWIGHDELAARPLAGAAWNRLAAEARRTCGPPRLDDQNDPANVCVMAKALVAARTGEEGQATEVMATLRALVASGSYRGHALALGRELIAYVIAADLVDLRRRDPELDAAFRAHIAALVTAPTVGGPRSLVECHERRPNNWGTHCGASRAAVAAYLGDGAELARVAAVFKGYLGDRGSYAGFEFGSDLSWQCDREFPVGVNPAGCRRDGHSIDGVVPDDQRRGGSFAWPPPKENYVYEAMQGALAQAVILHRAGFDAFGWQDRALRRVFVWLHEEARFPSTGDDTWQTHLVNHFYRTSFPTQVPARPGKNVGWTDWTHGQ